MSVEPKAIQSHYIKKKNPTGCYAAWTAKC